MFLIGAVFLLIGIFILFTGAAPLSGWVMVAIGFLIFYLCDIRNKNTHGDSGAGMGVSLFGSDNGTDGWGDSGGAVGDAGGGDGGG